MPDKITKQQRSRNMSHIKGKDTSIEVKVRKYLYHRGYRYRKNYKVLPGTPDIVLTKYRTAIFINGCFWHHHYNCKYAVYPKSRQDYWITKIDKNVENDIKNYKLLEQLDYKVIVVWECELKEAFEDRMKELVNEIEKIREGKLLMNIEYEKMRIRDFAENMIKGGLSFERIRNCNTDGSNVDEMNEFLKYNARSCAFSDEVTLAFFRETIDEIKESYDHSLKLQEQAALISDAKKDNNTEISKLKRDSWPLYKKKLKTNGFSDVSIANIEYDADKIRKRLNVVCDVDIEPIKGLVVGSIQSGKTANMTALIAQCADAGWNCFIVISGMLESLRQQTEHRMLNDLENGNNHWIPLRSIYTSAVYPNEEIQGLRLDSVEKYICIVLKNKTRLLNINNWLKRGKARSKQLRVLIIDDESDQGSINTKPIEKKEQTAINKQITDLVNKNKNGKYWGAINYVSYTATPYANILNDSKENSLYPKNFIATLTPNDLYIGPYHIFGIKEEGYNGMSIIREINSSDINKIDNILEANANVLPNSLKTSIFWFICAVASMRFQNYNKPISMLVNVSPKIDHHSQIEGAIYKWMKNLQVEEICQNCKIIFEEEIRKFNKEKFLEEYPNYERSNLINAYPTFDEIKPFIIELVQGGPSRIKLSDEQQKIYSRNIHLCVDNSRPYSEDVEENTVLRLLYPIVKDEKNPNPAFIVVGGNTLSRGLTIEGLVSTYFYRNGRQADTLMQMGRWFGYRLGYELYPRIWMDNSSVKKFQFLSQLDYDLRNDLRKYMDTNYSPLSVGPLINNTPKVSWLRIAAKNKMQSAIPAEFNFIGYQMQTTSFSKNEVVQKNNLEVTKEFIYKLGKFENSRTGNSKVWKDIELDRVLDYLSSYNFYKREQEFDEIEIFKKWLLKASNDKLMDVKKWNVILAGLKDEKNGTWPNEEHSLIHKVTRTSKVDPELSNHYDIGVLRSYEDCFEDINDKTMLIQYDEEICKILQGKNKNGERENFYHFKQRIKFDVKPMIIIYIIDKNSKARKKSNRKDLNSKNDLVGLYLTIPGNPNNKNHFYKITVKLENNEGM